MSYVFLVPKKFDSKKCPVIFRFISGKITAENFIPKNFMVPKDSSLNFRGSLFGYFCDTLLISVVNTLLRDSGSLLPARTVTVKQKLTTQLLKRI